MFDRVIVSCDDSHFKEFWPIVSKAWEKFDLISMVSG